MISGLFPDTSMGQRVSLELSNFYPVAYIGYEGNQLKADLGQFAASIGCNVTRQRRHRLVAGSLR